MSFAEELQKLEGLRWNGTLTDAEFAQAKAALLAKLSHPPALPPDATAAAKLGEQLAEVRYQNELERIDREWEAEKERYTVPGQNGRREIPTAGGGIAGGVIIGVFGTFWTLMALAITGGAPSQGPFALAKVFFPLFGVAFTVGGIWLGVHTYKKAALYNQAFEAYQKRRAAVNPDDFR